MLGMVATMTINELIDCYEQIHEFKDSVLLTIREERPDLEQEVNSIWDMDLNDGFVETVTLLKKALRTK